MTPDPFSLIPPVHREFARDGWRTAFGTTAIDRLRRVGGGSSGASLLRIDCGPCAYLMRVEGPATALMPRNPHRHTCTRLAAEAGLAPPLRYLDDTAGVQIIDWIDGQPLATYPGGPLALAAALGRLLARLQTTTPFPRLVYYPDLLSRMLGQVGRFFAPGTLDRHVERLAAIRAQYDRDQTPEVSSHNDLNSGNILFDGARLWFIDWESGYRNDPLVDASILLDNFAVSPELERAFLLDWIGQPPDAPLLSRLALVRCMTRLYYACFLLDAAAKDGVPDPDVSAPDPEAVAHAIDAFRQSRQTAQTIRVSGRAYLDGFLYDHQLLE